MRYRIRLNDGTEFEVRWCGVTSGVLNINLWSDMTFLQIAQVFANPAATSRITFLHGNQEETFENYTDLTVINHVEDYIISLRRAANGTVTQTL